MKDQNIDTMGWNAPGSGGNGNDENSHREPPRQDDPWGRRSSQKKNGFDADALLKTLKDMFLGKGGNKRKSTQGLKKESKFGKIILEGDLAKFYLK